MSKYIIVGGAGGIGSAIARRLADAGHAVHLIGRNGARLAELAGQLKGTHSIADVGNRASLDAAILAAGPELAGLCYAVGTINLKSLMRLTDTDIDRDFEVNAKGAFRAVQAAMPALKAFPGTASIVLFSTVAVGQGFSSHVSVSMAKGAVEGLTKALAAELAPKIRVNCIAPSLTRTPLAAGLTSNEAMATAISGLHAMQRLGKPDDIAAMAALLLQQDAGWITGQIIAVDGGRSTISAKG